MPRLVIMKGAGAGSDHAVGTECVLGRAPEVDFVIEDNLVSRRHVRVYQDGGSYSLEDLGSRNGTSVNGRRIVKCSLEDGDRIVLGTTELVFKQKSLVERPGGQSSAAAAAKGAAATAPHPPAATRMIAVPPVVARPPTKPAAPAAPASSAKPPPPPAKAPPPGPIVTKKRRYLS